MITFSEKELEFLEREFHLTPEQAAQLSDDELLDLSDRCFDIELEGDLLDGKKMPDRCGIASGIVDRISSEL